MADLPKIALSLKQPWAHLMLNLPPEHRKTIENRTWATTFRGEIWVHASQGMTKPYFYEACEFALRAGVPRDLLPNFDALPRGGIVGRWRIVDVMLPGGKLCGPLARGVTRADHPRKGDPWHMPEQFGFIIEDARPVPFVACGGSRGYWRVPDDVLEKLARSA